MKRKPIVVPEPIEMKFDGVWIDVDGFSNLDEFISREFNIPRGSWEIIEVSDEGTGIRILPSRRVEVWGDRRIYLATLLQLFIQGRGKLPIVEVKESLRFGFRGFHLDVARGGVATIDTLKALLRWLFLLKYNYFALYVEDLFPWDRYPDIGVHRGRYSNEEWKELVEYGKRLGIEVFPSLELSGHMERILVLPRYREYSEWWPFEDILGSGVLDLSNPNARKFAEDLLEEALMKTESIYIHIGGDETWVLGRGRSLDRLGRFEGPRLYAEHHSRLIEIVRKYNKIPLLWGDMISGVFLRELGMEREHWEKLLSEPIWREALIANWDYSPRDREYFRNSIKMFKERGFKQIVCPGIWNWNLFYPDFDKALANLRGFLGAAREEGVEGFMVTAWGDDGCECLYSFIYPLILAAIEIAEGSGEWEEKWLALTGEDRRVLEFRKMLGSSEITRAIKEFIARGTKPSKDIEDRLKQILSYVESIPLSRDLMFMKRVVEIMIRAIHDKVTVSDFIGLANEYASLWLSERKKQNLDYVYRKFWISASRLDLLKLIE